MPAQVVSFLRRARPVSRDWSQEELAEFYRVEAALLQSGMRIETDRGVTDEGDPWFAFCRTDDGETFIHFARIDGRYIIAGPAYEGVAQGYDFPELVRDLISRHPLVNPALQRRNNSNIFMHPAALLIAVVGTAFFKTDAAKAAEASADDHKGDKRHIAGASPATVPAPSAPTVAPAAHQAGGQVVMDAVQTLSLVASAMAAMSPASSVGAAAGPFAPLPVPAAETELPAAVARTASASFDHSLPADAGLAALQPIHAVVESPIQTAAVGAFLSLTAVLQDLPSPEPIQQASALSSVLAILPTDTARTYAQFEAAQLFAAQAEAKAAQAAPPAAAPAAAAPPAQAAASTLVINLSSAALPDVASVRLVRDLGAGVTQDTVLKLDQLPTVLAQLLARGEHLDSPAYNLTAPPADLSLGLGGTVTVPTHDGALPLPTDVAGPASPVTAVDLTPLPQAPAKVAIDAIIAEFVDRTGHVEVAINGHDILMYDARIITDNSLQSRSGSVTFSFDDGSSVSLIGLSQTLHDIGALH
jgi:hypothetical protein